MKNIISNSIKVILGVFVGMSVVCVEAASTGVEVETEWWIANGDATIVQTNEYITVSFSKQSETRIPDSQSADFHADETVAPDAFVGDYQAADIKGLSFRIMVESVALPLPKGVTLFLQSDVTGCRWTILVDSLTFNDVTGEWAVNNIPIDANNRGNWYAAMNRANQGREDELWAESVKNVSMIGFTFSRQGYEAQSYSIDDFRFVGDGFVSDPMVLKRLQDHLAQNISNIDQLTEQMKSQDSDGDGISDYEAIQTGRDPGLAVKIVSVEADGITLEWPKAANRKYTLLRCSSLKDGFTEVVLDGGFENESGVKTYKDTTATGDVPYFYRVVKKEN